MFVCYVWFVWFTFASFDSFGLLGFVCFAFVRCSLFACMFVTYFLAIEWSWFREWSALSRLSEKTTSGHCGPSASSAGFIPSSMDMFEYLAGYLADWAGWAGLGWLELGKVEMLKE